MDEKPVHLTGAVRVPASIPDPSRNGIAPSQTYCHAYVTSPSYSGSTILSMAMDMHPAVCTIGEFYICYPLESVDTPHGYQCSCGIALENCDYWQRIHLDIERITGTRVNFFDFRLRPRFAKTSALNGAYLPLRRNRLLDRASRRAATLLPGYAGKLREFQRRHGIYFPAIFQAAGASCFVDASKSLGYLRLLPQLQADNTGVLKIKVIRLSRRIEGTAASEKRRDPNFNRQDLKLVANRVIEHRRLADRILSSFPPDSVLAVDYETFCERPENEMRRIFRFLELPEIINLDLKSQPHHVAGNTTRFLRNFTGIRRDENWREILSAEEIRLIDSIRAIQHLRSPGR